MKSKYITIFIILYGIVSLPLVGFRLIKLIKNFNFGSLLILIILIVFLIFIGLYFMRKIKKLLVNRALDKQWPPVTKVKTDSFWEKTTENKEVSKKTLKKEYPWITKTQ